MFPSNFVNYTPPVVSLTVSLSLPLQVQFALDCKQLSSSGWFTIAKGKAKWLGKGMGLFISASLWTVIFSPNWMCWTEQKTFILCIWMFRIFSRKLMEHDRFYPQKCLDLMFLRQNGRLLLVVSQPPVAQWQQLPRITLDDEAEQLKLCYQVHGPSTILWRMSKKSVTLLKQVDNRS